MPSGLNNLPTVRVEIEGMRLSLLHAITARSEEWDAMLKDAIDAALTPEAFQEAVAREARLVIDKVIRDEVEKFYRYGHGREVIRLAVEARLGLGATDV